MVCVRACAAGVVQRLAAHRCYVDQEEHEQDDLEHESADGRGAVVGVKRNGAELVVPLDCAARLFDAAKPACYQECRMHFGWGSGAAPRSD